MSIGPDLLFLAACLAALVIAVRIVVAIFDKF
jgi:hypothetical protein